MTNLASQLVAVPQREVAGSNSAMRYHYQALYGLALIFETHKKDGDYAVVFEYHDDIAMLNDSRAPTKVSFFQVKTKAKGHWNITDILKQKKSKDKDGKEIKSPSFLANMYDNVIKFGDQVEGTTFVSNVELNFGKKSHSFSLVECNTAELEKVSEHLKSVYSGITSIRTDVVRFQKSDLSLDDLDTHAKGKLNNFVVEHLGAVDFSLDALYRAVVDECTRKSRSTVFGKDLPEVLNLRGITRSNADGWLTQIRQRVAAPRWEEISSNLAGTFFHRTAMGREWRKYCIEVLDTNAALSAVRGEIAKFLNNGSCDQLKELQQIIELVMPNIQLIALERMSPISEEKIKVMIIYEACARTQD